MSVPTILRVALGLAVLVAASAAVAGLALLVALTGTLLLVARLRRRGR